MNRTSPLTPPRTSPPSPLLAGEGGATGTAAAFPSPFRRGVWGEAAPIEREAFARGPGMTKRARLLRNTMTDAERKLWGLIRADRLGLRFRRQLVFDQRYILDFYAPSIRLAIEVDGAQHMERSAPDLLRTDYLVARGVTVLRFWNTEVLLETKAVVQAIAEVADELAANSPLRLGVGPGGRPPHQVVRSPEFDHLKINFGEAIL